MSGPYELIYSAQRTDFEPGRRYANPRFFSAVREGVSRVTVIGDWPDVVRAYEAAGVPVSVQGAAVHDAIPVAPVTDHIESSAVEPRGHSTDVPIPDDWRNLPYLPRSAGEPCLRSLAAQVSSVPILNKALAIEAIEAELARRNV